MTKKSYAKVNVFLKIAGKRDNYHELVSRFVRVKNLYDEISLVKKECQEFTLMGSFGCELYKNTIYKAYLALKQINSSVENYFKNHAVMVKKNIPEFAGMGGGSSNAATFILMVNEVCDLKLSQDKMAEIGLKIGADVPFFIYEYDSANVTGIGEKIEKFEEPSMEFETITPEIMCDTGVIYRTFREKFYKEITDNEAEQLMKMSSRDYLLQHNIKQANDLYEPAVNQYQELELFAKPNWFFSGSGSTFFRVIN